MTKRIVCDSQADAIAIEDLNVSGMMRNDKLSKHIGCVIPRDPEADRIQVPLVREGARDSGQVLRLIEDLLRMRLA